MSEQVVEKFDAVSFIMTVEGGEFTIPYYIKGMAELIKSGTVWGMQGSWVKSARQLIYLGYISSEGVILRLPGGMDAQAGEV